MFTPSADTRIIYVSQSSGNDANSGLRESAPVKTVSRGASLLRDGYPDWLLLKAGDTWTENTPNLRKSGRSSSEKMRLGMYGQGSRPVLRPAVGEDAVIYMSTGDRDPPRGHWAITDIDFEGNGPGQSALMLMGNIQDFLMEGCMINHFGTGIVAQAYWMYDVGGQPTHMRDITFRRNVIQHSSFAASSNQRAMGLFAGADFDEANPGVVGATLHNLTVEENVFHANGVLDGTLRSHGESHSWYINGYDESRTYNVVVRGNIVTLTDGGKTTAYGLTVEDNLFLKTAASVIACCQPNTTWDVPTVIRNNVQIDSTLNQITPYTTQGFGLYIAPHYTEVANNITTKLRATTYGSAMNLDAASHARIHDNIVYDWFVPGGNEYVFRAVDMTGGSYSDIEFRNNQLAMPRGGYVYNLENGAGASALSFSGNQYQYAPSTIGLSLAHLNFSSWVSSFHTSGESNNIPAFPDPDRDVTTYMRDVVHAPSAQQSFDAFMVEVLQQSRLNWRSEFTAHEVNRYIRAGFGR